MTFLVNTILPGIRARFSHMEPVDIAEILGSKSRTKPALSFRILPKEVAADTFSEMDPEEQQKLINNFTDQEVKVDVLNEM